MTTADEYKIEIIVSVNNNLAFIRETIPAMLRNTLSSVRRLTLLGNNCDKTTTDYLSSVVRSITQAQFIPVQGSIVSVVNDIVRKTDAKYICFLCSNTLVFDGWLDSMVSVIARDNSAKAVMPISNVQGDRIVPMPPGCTINTMDWYFKSRDSMEARTVFIDREPCVLIDSEYIRSNNFLDETYQGLMWALLDLSITTVHSGPEARLAENLYVYQYPDNYVLEEEHNRKYLFS
jgi:hypothetical protein